MSASIFLVIKSKSFVYRKSRRHVSIFYRFVRSPILPLLQKWLVTPGYFPFLYTNILKIIKGLNFKYSLIYQ